MTNEDAISEIIDITSSNMTYPQMIKAIKDAIKSIVAEEETDDFYEDEDE